jgi:NADH dehydrogenase
VFVIGDAAHCTDKNGSTLPGVAQVAMQQGRFVAKTILYNTHTEKFVYNDKGNMATIGRAKAVAYLFGKVQLWGFAAWAIWALIHVVSLIKFRNRVSVMSEWLWYYITYQPGARLIIEE